MDRRRDQAGCVLAAALALLVAGCSREPAQPPRTRIPAGLETRFYPPPGWTWGQLPLKGAPPIRYGVGAPPKAVRGGVLILPGFGEPAETWFETANDLVSAGYAVWIMDLAGQGGSGRWTKPADKAHLPSMQPNLDAVRRMVLDVVRPTGAPLFLLGSGLGGQVGLRAAEAGLPGVDALVLSSPSLTDWPLSTPRPLQSIALAKGAGLVGLDRRYAPGQGDWRAADSRRAEHGSRAAVPQAWMRANADLRTGGVTLGWLTAYGDSVARARSAGQLAAVRLPVLMLDGGDGQTRKACERIKDCRYARTAANGHLAADSARQAWLRSMLGFMAEHGRGYSVAAAPVRTATGP